MLYMILSDTHSPTGLLSPGRHELHESFLEQTKLQKVIWKQFVDVCKYASKTRKDGERLTVVCNGDIIEGAHHGSLELNTLYISEHENLFIEAFTVGLEIANFNKKTDVILFVSGTDAHVGESEERIARRLVDQGYGVIPSRKPKGRNDGVYVHNDLRIDDEHGEIWFAHHGPNPGKGHNSGNGLRNRAREIYMRCLAEVTKPPRWLIYSHYHEKAYVRYTYKDMYACDVFITPSFSTKGRYGTRVAPFFPADIGALFLRPGGFFDNGLQWIFHTMSLEDRKAIKI